MVGCALAEPATLAETARAARVCRTACIAGAGRGRGNKGTGTGERAEGKPEQEKIRLC